MKILVVRHGIAMDKVEYQLAARTTSSASAPRTAPKEAVDAGDDFRPLTLDGIRKMKKGARAIESLVHRPSLLVSSPLTRALQTAEILQDRWSTLEILVAEDLRPGSKPQSIATWINQRVDGEELIVIVGHEPHLSTLITWFLKGSTGQIVELKKGGACLIDFSAGPIDRGAGVLEWLVTPSILRSMKN